MELVGNYGVSIHFSDGHSTGIYRFVTLLNRDLVDRDPDA
jgi:DUF971 family protein